MPVDASRQHFLDFHGYCSLCNQRVPEVDRKSACPATAEPLRRDDGYFDDRPLAYWRSRVAAMDGKPGR